MGLFSKLFGSKQTRKTEIENKLQTEISSIEIVDLKNHFDFICKDTIIPFFKENGFKRKALHFSKKLTISFNASMFRKVSGIHTMTV